MLPFSDDQPPLMHIIRTARLKFFGHIARADPSVDHSRVLRSSVTPLPRDWNHRSGRPRQTWLRTVESDDARLNIGLVTALSPSADLTGMEIARGNGNVHWTSHIMMMTVRFAVCYSIEDDIMFFSHVIARYR